MANDFTWDTNCVGLWRFESGALTTDTLAVQTALTAISSPSANNSVEIEGSACCEFDGGGECFYITDANLSSDFPCKNGETNTTFSMCAWFRFAALPAPDALVGVLSKYDVTNSKRCFRIAALGTADSPILKVYLGQTSAPYYDATIEDSTTTFAINTWYHIGFSYNGSSKAWIGRICEDGGSPYADNGTTPEVVTVNDSAFFIGAVQSDGITPTGPWNGQLDEIVMFKDVLSLTEMAAIQAGTYAAPAVGTLAAFTI